MAKSINKVTPKSVKDSLKEYSNQLPFFGDSVEFTPSIYKDLPENIKPVFTIKRLDRGDIARLKVIGTHIEYLSREMAKKSIDSGDELTSLGLEEKFVSIQLQQDSICFEMLKGWTMLGGDGKKVSFNEKNFKKLPSSVIKEIGAKGGRISGLSEDEQSFLD